MFLFLILREKPIILKPIISLLCLWCLCLVDIFNLVKKVFYFCFVSFKKEVYKSLQIINAGKGVEKREPSYTVGGNAN